VATVADVEEAAASARPGCDTTEVGQQVDRNDPGNPENKYRTRESSSQLRATLLRWDPIGVAATPEAADEYDRLISPLLHRLHGGATEREIASWLVDELTDHFGMTADESRGHRLAADLVQWWQRRVAEAS